MAAQLLVNTCVAFLVVSLAGVSCDEVVLALLGEMAQMNCDSPQGAQPQPRDGAVEWFVERAGKRSAVFTRDEGTGQLRPAPAFEGRVELGDDTALRLQGVLLQDRATFVCVTHDGEMKMMLEVYAFPEKLVITRSPSSVVLGLGKQLIGTCISSGSYPEANLTWYKNSQALLNKSPQNVRVDKHVVRESSGLFSVTAHLFYNPTMEDKQASFHCEVQYSQPGGQLGRMKSDDIQILLTYPSEHVNLTIESPLTPIKQGDKVTLKCSVDGTSEPEFTFQRVQKNGSVEDLHIGAESTFTLSGVARDHSGLYRCTTFDFDQPLAEMLTADTYVEVNWIEDVTVTPAGNHTVAAGTSLAVECGGRSEKPLSISWTKDGKRLAQGGQLQLSAVTFGSSGAYACEVSMPSVPGLSVSRLVHISVEGEPRVTLSDVLVEPQRLTLVCTATGNPLPEIKWSVPQTPVEVRVKPWELRSSVVLPRGATQQAMATCTARNAHGSAKKTLLGPTVPPPVSESPPPSPHASATNTSSKTVIIAIIIALGILFLICALIFCLCKKKNLCFKNRYSPTRKQTQSSVGSSPDTYMAPPDQDLKA